MNGETKAFIETGNSVCGTPPNSPEMVECDRCDGTGIDPEYWCNHDEDVCREIAKVEVWEDDDGLRIRKNSYCDKHIKIPDDEWLWIYRYGDPEDTSEMKCEKCHGELEIEKGSDE